MERPRLENLARWIVLVCSASKLTLLSQFTVRMEPPSLPPSLPPYLLFLKVVGHWLHWTVWSTTDMEMLMFCTLRGTLAAAAAGREEATVLTGLTGGLTGLTGLRRAAAPPPPAPL